MYGYHKVESWIDKEEEEEDELHTKFSLFRRIFA